ncbi:porin [Reichenbachiella sp. MSK19-1]|uniref:porin n=1 Tax=Reichenbachiella sp. MSK19-1 TaxID=1897631 RepID=UPI000E6CD0DD|nr:porin [Reichenbachiella sp. MSK19-1]RJE74541.1 porin [Reichenbachiella sp. MSK19-1]
MRLRLSTLVFLLLIAMTAHGQIVGSLPEKKHDFFNKISISGYMQVRYNKLLETNPELKCEQCDESWGGDTGGLYLRRLRFKLYGQISPRIYFYFQPDFSKTAGDAHHVGRLKDAYVDIGLDKDNEFRFRLGQSKVPYGFENMQSSSKRLPLDRDDALNSAVKDERDMGLFFYWASKEKRELMHDLKAQGLKHSGDFGVFALGIYNGQTANHLEQNKTFHVVSRFSYPIVLGKQIIEPGIQAYSGKFVLLETSEEVLTNPKKEYTDQRAAVSFVLYPQPFGIQAEYNIGRGPEYDKTSESIKVKSLHGGYVTFSYKMDKWKQTFIPFVRLQYYSGGKKHELDARSYDVRESEIGIEWQVYKTFELVAMYTLSHRRFEDYELQNNIQEGRLLRLQAQLNF